MFRDKQTFTVSNCKRVGTASKTDLEAAFENENHLHD